VQTTITQVQQCFGDLLPRRLREFVVPVALVKFSDESRNLFLKEMLAHSGLPIRQVGNTFVYVQPSAAIAAATLSGPLDTSRMAWNVREDQPYKIAQWLLMEYANDEVCRMRYLKYSYCTDHCAHAYSC